MTEAWHWCHFFW